MGRRPMFTATHVRCPRCEEWLPRELFTPDKSRPGGTVAHCRPCKAAMRRERYATDETYRSAEQERTKRQYHANPKPHNARRMAWVKANPDKARAAEQRHRERHPEKMRVKWTRQRVLRRAESDLTTEWAQVLRADPCAYCGAPGGEIDHIAPVSRGGTSNTDNLTGACRSCNGQKMTKPLLGALLYIHRDRLLAPTLFRATVRAATGHTGASPWILGAP